MPTRIFISIVSHHHEMLIMNNAELKAIHLLANVEVIIKDNVKNNDLKRYCEDAGFTYLSLKPNSGFGTNNNIIFNFCKQYKSIEKNDFFIVMNPDVQIDLVNFKLLYNCLMTTPQQMLTINLFRNDKMTIADNSLRYFPTRFSLFNMLLLRPVTKSYDKTMLLDNSIVDWASASFLVIKADVYSALNGFNEDYFMYYEDVDMCYRYKNKYNNGITFLKNISAIHIGAYKNRDIKSIHFKWYIKSLFRFLFQKHFKESAK